VDENHHRVRRGSAGRRLRLETVFRVAGRRTPEQNQGSSRVGVYEHFGCFSFRCRFRSCGRTWQRGLWISDKRADRRNDRNRFHGFQSISISNPYRRRYGRVTIRFTAVNV